MGYRDEYSSSQRPYGGRSPLPKGGFLLQRMFLLMLLGLFAIYTVVDHLATRNILTQCVELTAHEANNPLPAISDPATASVPTSETSLDDHSEEQSSEVEITKSPEIAKVTMIYGKDAKDKTMRLVIEGHRKHAARHGHGIHILESQLLSGMRSKLAWMLRIMLEEMQKPEDMRVRWLAWFDPEVVIMNPNIPLDIFLPPTKNFPNINLLVTDDHNGLNTGAFMIQVGEWGVDFLVDALALRTYQPDLKLRYAEQSAMAVMITDMEQYQNRTMHVPQRWFNAYRGPRNDNGKLIRGQKLPPNAILPGDLQLHFAGKKSTAKALIPIWLAIASDESAGWQVPLSESKLASEIAVFWKLQREMPTWNMPVSEPSRGGRKAAEGKESPKKDNSPDVETETAEEKDEPMQDEKEEVQDDNQTAKDDIKPVEKKRKPVKDDAVTDDAVTDDESAPNVLPDMETEAYE